MDIPAGRLVFGLNRLDPDLKVLGFRVRMKVAQKLREISCFSFNISIIKYLHKPTNKDYYQ